MSLIRINGLFIKSCFSVRCIQFSSIVFNVSLRKKYCTVPIATQNALLDIDKLPRYREINGETVTYAIPALIKEAEKNFEAYEAELLSKNNFTWQNVVVESESLFQRFQLAWGAVSHLHSVRNDESLRSAKETVQPAVVSMSHKIMQSGVVFKALEYLDSQNKSSAAEKRILQSSLRDMKDSGVHLQGEEKIRFNEISQKLAELQMKFSNNVLDSTKNFSYLIVNKADTNGLPDSLLAAMAHSAGSSDASIGPWKVTLDMSCFLPFMKYCTNRNLREKVYLAYIARASQGDSDNTDIIESVRLLRKEMSLLLGFESYATLSLNRKMAKVPSAVWDMIIELRDNVKEVANQELKSLEEFAQQNGHDGDLMHWDLSFWSEKQKENLFSVQEEKLREYFPLETVLNGLFELCKKLFDIHIEEVCDGSVETWHEDVRFFNINDNVGNIIASFFLDPYTRPHEKNGGAWHNSALDLNEALDTRPVSYLICNQRPPVGSDVPSLMTLNEVRTLFHEFGHGLQHMLTTVKYPSAAGINNIEWDAVELPSQFMENWLYDWNTMRRISSHYVTGDHLPDEIFQQLIASKNYQAGLANLRQVYFAALDMELHTSDDDWMSVMQKVSGEYTVLTPLPEDKFPCSFMHIFAGGYAAGYYSYKWAEVLSADAFSAFEEIGLDDEDGVQRLGRRFRDTILAKGGSIHPEDNFIDMRGRKPTVRALLKSYGFK